MINTTNIPSGEAGGSGSFTPKTFNPGNYQCIISDVTLDTRLVTGKTISEVTLHLVGEDIPGFEGFNIDMNNLALGKHKGQIGRVRTDRWGYSDFTFNDGSVKTREDQLLIFLKILCQELGIVPWLDGQNGKHATVESLFAAFRQEKPFSGIQMWYCLGAREYLNKNKYTAYDLFLPKQGTLGKPFCKEGDKVMKYFPSEHLIKYKPKELGGGFTASTQNTTQAIVTTQSNQITQNPAVVITNAVPEDDFLKQIEELAKSDKVANQGKGGAMTPNTTFLANNQSQLQKESQGLTANDIVVNNGDLPFEI